MMEAANVHNKLILAVVQEDDYDTTVSELNQNGFFVIQHFREKWKS